MLDKDDAFAPSIVRANGDVLAGTQNDGIYLAKDCAAAGPCTAWTQLANAPHVNCFGENHAHELWACSANFSSPTVVGDGYGLMKTTDYSTWTGVLRFQDTGKLIYVRREHAADPDVRGRPKVRRARPDPTSPRIRRRAR